MSRSAALPPPRAKCMGGAGWRGDGSWEMGRGEWARPVASFKSKREGGEGAGLSRRRPRTGPTDPPQDVPGTHLLLPTPPALKCLSWILICWEARQGPR